jgi:RNA polymerase sigma-70 factor, ECF subfamily
MLSMAVPTLNQSQRGDTPLRVVEGSEAELVRAAQAGSKEAFEGLFALHWARAYRAAWLVVHDAAAAEDIAQEAFIAALRALDRFDRRRPFGPWLSKIVVNRAIDHARARRLRAVPTPGVAAAAPPSPEGWSDELMAALSRLPVEQRAVVVMRYALEFTPGEIAKALGMPRGTVNSRLRRGLDHLGRLLDED